MLGNNHNFATCKLKGILTTGHLNSNNRIMKVSVIILQRLKKILKICTEALDYFNNAGENVDAPFKDATMLIPKSVEMPRRALRQSSVLTTTTKEQTRKRNIKGNTCP